MPILRYGNEAIEFRPFVEEAVCALRFVRVEYVDWLSVKIIENISYYDGRRIREAGARLTKDERIQIGMNPFDGGVLSWEVWNCLTPAGRLAPIENFDDTVRRALSNGMRTLQSRVARRVLKNGFFVGVKFAGPPQIGICDEAEKMVGKLLKEPPELPLPNCSRKFCSCHWRLVTEWELEQDQSGVKSVSSEK